MTTRYFLTLNNGLQYLTQGTAVGTGPTSSFELVSTNQYGVIDNTLLPLVVPALSFQPLPGFTKIFRNATNQITQVSFYKDSSMNQEIFRKTPNRVNGKIDSVTYTNYLVSPSISITKQINKVSNAIDSITASYS